MPIQIDELIPLPDPTVPAWAQALSEQISRVASDVATQTKMIDRLQRQLEELRDLVDQRVKS